MIKILIMIIIDFQLSITPVSVLTSRVVDDRCSFLFRYFDKGTLYHWLAEGPISLYPADELDAEEVWEWCVKAYL